MRATCRTTSRTTRPHSAKPLILMALCLLVNLGPGSANVAQASEAWIDELLELPATLPDWREQARIRNANRPVEERDWFDGPPPDEARLDILLGWWIDRWPDDSDLPPITDRLRERILESVLQEPGYLGHLVGLLPKTAEAYRQLEALLAAHPFTPRTADEREYYGFLWQGVAHRWLVLHNPARRDELFEVAKLTEADAELYCAEEVLPAMAAVDWSRAAPLLRQHAQGVDAHVAAVALGVLYRHATEADEPAEASRCRAALQKIVVEPGSERARHLACTAVMKGDWPGRDAWFLALFSDPTLDSQYCSPLDDVVKEDPDYWIPQVVTLLNGPSRQAHHAAAHVLESFHLDQAREDALRPLLPWVVDRNWASRPTTEDRLRLIQSLSIIDLPQATPALMWVAENESDSILSAAAEALAHYDARETVPVLRAAVLREPTEDQRLEVIRAIVELDGYSDEELGRGLEAYARLVAMDGSGDQIRCAYGPVSAPLPPDVSIGHSVVSTPGRAQEAAAIWMIGRLEMLGREEPGVAETAWKIIAEWPTPVVENELARRLAAGEFDASTVREALHRRESMRHRPDLPLRDRANEVGASGAIAALLLADTDLYRDILAGTDRDAQRALLAGARLIAEPLPVKVVAALFDAGDQTLSEAAELYLETAETPEAWNALAVHRSNRYSIFGFEPKCDFGRFSGGGWGCWEPRMIELITAEDGPDEIYALLSGGTWGSPGQIVICVRGDRVEGRFYEEWPAFTPLPDIPAKWPKLHEFIMTNAIEGLAPLEVQVMDATELEYLHLTRAFGRRVHLSSAHHEPGSIYAQLVDRFWELRGKER